MEKIDYADKGEWLRRMKNDGPDPFQIISADAAIFLLIVGGFLGFVFRGFL